MILDGFLSDFQARRDLKQIETACSDVLMALVNETTGPSPERKDTLMKALKFLESRGYFHNSGPLHTPSNEDSDKALREKNTAKLLEVIEKLAETDYQRESLSLLNHYMINRRIDLTPTKILGCTIPMAWQKRYLDLIFKKAPAFAGSTLRKLCQNSPENQNIFMQEALATRNVYWAQYAWEEGTAEQARTALAILDENTEKLFPGKRIETEEANIVKQWIDAGNRRPEERAELARWAAKVFLDPAYDKTNCQAIFLNGVHSFIEKHLSAFGRDAEALREKIEKEKLTLVSALAITGFQEVAAEILLNRLKKEEKIKPEEILFLSWRHAMPVGEKGRRETIPYLLAVFPSGKEEGAGLAFVSCEQRNLTPAASQMLLFFETLRPEADLTQTEAMQAVPDLFARCYAARPEFPEALESRIAKIKALKSEAKPG